MHAKALASNRLARANRASHGPRGKTQSPEGTRGAKGSHKGKTSKTGQSGLENSKSEVRSETQELAQTCPNDNSWFHDGWSYDEWNDDWISVVWHEGWEQTYDASANSFSLGGLDVSATSCPKRFEWVKMRPGHSH